MQYLAPLIATALASFYVLALILDRAAGALFGVLVLLSLITIISQRRIDGKSFWQMARQYWPLSLAMLSPLIAVIANQLASGNFSGRSIDQASRLAFFSLIFWGLQLVPLKSLRHMQWAFILGAFLSGIKMYVLTDNGINQYGTDFIPINIFAEFALLLGVFSVFSIAWNAPREKLLILLKLLACGIVVYGAYISRERGSWLTIPVFGAIAYYLMAKKIQRKHKVLMVVVIVIALGAISQFGSIMRMRFENAQSDIKHYLQGTDINTSIGIRFQLWRGSWLLFKENPVFGVDAEGYPKALEELEARKIISPESARHPHSHNEVLFMLARFGLFGLAAILAVYFVPICYFVRRIRDNDKEVRSVAAMGLALCLGVLVLGLTDVVFLWWEAFPFYALSVALLLTYIKKRKEILHQDALSLEPKLSGNAEF